MGLLWPLGYTVMWTRDWPGLIDNSGCDRINKDSSCSGTASSWCGWSLCCLERTNEYFPPNCSQFQLSTCVLLPFSDETWSLLPTVGRLLSIFRLQFELVNIPRSPNLVICLRVPFGMFRWHPSVPSRVCDLVTFPNCVAPTPSCSRFYPGKRGGQGCFSSRCIPPFVPRYRPLRLIGFSSPRSPLLYAWNNLHVSGASGALKVSQEMPKIPDGCLQLFQNSLTTEKVEYTIDKKGKS
jgi:hypothetical protein